MTDRIAVGTPVTVSSEYGQHAGRNDLVVLSDQGTGYGVGPKGNDPRKSDNGAEGWLYYSDSTHQVTPKTEPSFAFKDIQKGDTIRRTATYNGATEVREGVGGTEGSYYWATEQGNYILAYDTDGTTSITDVTLALVNRPEPVKKPWEDAERGTVIKRGSDHVVRNAGGWLFIYSNGSEVQRSQRDTDVLLRGEKDLQVIPA